MAMAMAYHLRTLGHLSDFQYKSICIELGRRGYRSAEPIGVERESSPCWRKVLGQLWQERVTRTDIAADLNIPVNELQSLLWSLASASEVPERREGGAGLSLIRFGINRIELRIPSCDFGSNYTQGSTPKAQLSPVPSPRVWRR